MRKYIEEHTDAKPKKYADSVNDIHHQTLEIENDTIEIVQNYSQTTIEIEKQANVEILTETDCTNGVILLKPTETVCFLMKMFIKENSQFIDK